MCSKHSYRVPNGDQGCCFLGACYSEEHELGFSRGTWLRLWMVQLCYTSLVRFQWVSWWQSAEEGVLSWSFPDEKVSLSSEDEQVAS